MLQKLREKTTGWVAAVIVGLLIVPFAFFGVNNYFSPEVDAYAARVETPAKFWVFGKETRDISPEQFRARFEQYRQQMRQALGENYDGRQLERPEVKRQVLDRMIDEEVLRLAAERDRLAISDTQVQQEILKIDAFKVDGTFNPDQYRLLLAGQGMTPKQFEQQARRDMLMQMLPSQIAASSLATDADVDAFIKLSEQKRNVSYLGIAPPPMDEGEVAAADVQAWYDAHEDEYRTEEQVSIEYVEIDAAELEVPTTIDEATLRQRYDEQKARYVEPDQRLTSHILIKLAADASDAEVDAARQKAADLAAQARAEGAVPGTTFAALAREHSDDTGSKATGGDLGWVTPGLMVKPFEDAMDALAAGEVSDPVRTEFGWHVIQVREVKVGSQVPFEQVRADLEREALETERERAFSDLSGRLVDQVYKDPTALVPAAKELGLSVQTVGPFGRAGGEGVAANPAIVNAAFSEAQLEGSASDPIELGPNHIAVIRVTEHKPAQARPLEEVRDAVAAAVRADRAAKAAKAKADALLARARGGASLDDLADEAGGKVESSVTLGRTAATPDRGIVTEAFALPRPVDDQPSLGLARLNIDSYALVAVTAVTEGDPSALPPQVRDMLRQQLSQARSSLETRAYLDALRGGFEIKVAEDRL